MNEINQDTFMLMVFGVFGICCILIVVGLCIGEKIKSIKVSKWIIMILNKEKINLNDKNDKYQLYKRFISEMPKTANNVFENEFYRILNKVVEKNTYKKIKNKTYYWEE